MSNMTDEGIMTVRQTACDALLTKRSELKMKNSKKLGDIMNRITVAEPKPRPGKAAAMALLTGGAARGAVGAAAVTIPASVIAARAAAAAAPKAKKRRGDDSDDDDEEELPEGTSGLTQPKSTLNKNSKYAHMFAGLVPGAGGSSGSAMDEDDDDDDNGEGSKTYGATGSHAMIRKWLEKDREAAGGGPGVYRTDTTRYYSLRDDEWKSDMIPEIMDGKNIADYVDPEIEKKLAELEAEEDALLAAEAEEEAKQAAAKAARGEVEDPEEAKAQAALLKEIRQKKQLARDKSHLEHGKNRGIMPRTAGRAPTAEGAKEHLTKLGLPESAVDKMVEKATVSGRKRGRSETRRADKEASAGAGMDMDDDDEEEGGSSSKGPSAKKARSSSRLGGDKSRSRSRGASASPGPRSLGIKSEVLRDKIRKEIKREQRVKFFGLKGEADRAIPTKMPKHLFSGKRGIGSTDWR